MFFKKEKPLETNNEGLMKVEQERDNEVTNKGKLNEVLKGAERILESEHPHTIFSYIKIFTDTMQNQRAVKILSQSRDNVERKKDYFDTTEAYFNPINHFIMRGDKVEIKKLDNPISVSNATAPVLTELWEARRIIDSINNIGKDVEIPKTLRGIKNKTTNEFEYHSTNHMASYIYPLGITLVWNGNHSIYAGMVKGEGTFKATQVSDVSRQYDAMYFDGTYLVDELEGDKAKVYFEIGALFEIGRLLLDYPELFPRNLAID